MITTEPLAQQDDPMARAWSHGARSAQDAATCRRCDGSGLEPPGRSGRDLLGLLLVLAASSVSWAVIGFGIGHWCR